MYVIVTNHVNWHRENLRSHRENVGNLKLQIIWVPCKSRIVFKRGNIVEYWSLTETHAYREGSQANVAPSTSFSAGRSKRPLEEESETGPGGATDVDMESDAPPAGPTGGDGDNKKPKTDPKPSKLCMIIFFFKIASF